MSYTACIRGGPVFAGLMRLMLLCCTRQCSVLHSLVQSIKGAGTNTLACAVAIVTLLILHDQGRALAGFAPASKSVFEDLLYC